MKWVVILSTVILVLGYGRAHAYEVSVISFDATQLVDDLAANATVRINTTGSSLSNGYLCAVFSKSTTGPSSFFGCTRKTDVGGDYGCIQTAGSGVGLNCYAIPSISSNSVATFSVSLKANTSSSNYDVGTHYLYLGRFSDTGSSPTWSPAYSSAEMSPQPIMLTSQGKTDCKMSDWGECSATCGSGTRTRTILTQPKNGGAACGETSEPCNTHVCPTVVPQPGNIFLNEFVACPSTGGEWVELYNGNDSTVTLTDWSIKDDKDNKSVISGQIGAKSYGVFEVHDLNNDIDTVRLYDGAGNSISSEYKHYDICNSSMSWSKTSTGSWQQSFIITKGEANRFPTPVPSPTATPTPKPTPTSTPDPTVLGESTDSAIPTFVVSNETAEGLATRSGTKKQESPVFAIIAIVLGIISLFSLGGYLWYDWKKKQSVPDATQ